MSSSVRSAREKPDALGTPDMLLLVSDELAVVDNVLGKLYLVVYADTTQPDAHAHGACAARASALAACAGRCPRKAFLKDSAPAVPLGCTFTEPEFLEAVRRSKEYIFAGDCMQVQISQRTSRRFEPSPLALYRALRGVNPSPYMYYFDFGDHHVVGRLARDPGAPRRRHRHAAADRRHAPARRHARGGRRARRRSCSPTRRSAPST